MTSSRRVKKGPGRRPQSANRQRFMELRAPGWSIRAAGRAVGISRSSANNWARGHKTSRDGKVVGFVPALDPLAIRQISPRYLSQDERIAIARRTGLSIRRSADKIGRARRPCLGSCGAAAAATALIGGSKPTARPAAMRRTRRHLRRVPIQSSVTVRPSKVASPQRGQPRNGRDHRKAHQRLGRRRPRFAQPMLSIHQRPFRPSDRSQATHWEGDLIVGKNQGAVIGTLVEPQTRLIRLLHLPRRDADSLHSAITAAVTALPPTLVRPITWDQGIEMARHIDITADLGAPVYFCDSHSPWQRGSNENTTACCASTSPRAPRTSSPTVPAMSSETSVRPSFSAPC